MTKKNILKWAVLVAILILPFLVYYIFVYNAKENFFKTLGYVGPRTYQEKEVNGELITDSTFYTIPDFELTSHHDTSVSAEDLRGNILLVNFFFTSCPSICPAMNYHVQQIQERFKGYEDFKIISISVDPEHDTVEVLREYAEDMQARSGRWYFLTGNRDSIYKISEKFLAPAMEDAAAEGGYLHSENLILVDWNGHIRSGEDDYGNLIGAYNSLQPVQLKTLKEDIKVLIAEYEKQKSIDEHRQRSAEKI